MPISQGLSMHDVKLHNRKAILTSLSSKSMTKSELSKQLNLTRASITLIVDEMISQNILHKSSNTKNDKSKYKKKIHINHNFKFVWGISIDTDYISVGISNLNREILGKKASLFNNTKSIKDLVYEISKLIEQIKYECGFISQQILGCGLCISENLLINKKLDIDTIINSIERILNTDVVFMNMTDALCLLEYDIKQNKDNLFLLRFTSDIFTSMILGNALFNKDFNYKGISHSIISPDGPKCPICGKNGCAYVYMSGNCLAHKINQIYSKEKTPNLYSSLGKNTSDPGNKSLTNVFWMTDQAIIDIVKESAKSMSILLLNIYEIFKPSNIVFCGRMIENERFLQSIYEVFSELLPDNILAILDTGSTTIKTNFIAACSLAIKKIFISKGGL